MKKHDEKCIAVPVSVLELLTDKRPMTKRDAFIDLCILSAESGSFECGTRVLAERWRWGKTAVADYLNELAEMGLITISRTLSRTVSRTMLTIMTQAFPKIARTVQRTVSRTDQREKERSKEIRENNPPSLSPTESVPPAGERRVPERNVIPPTVEMVKTYCDSRRNGIDAQEFVDHYTARGWKYNGGLTMTDWQAAVRTWEAKRKNDLKPTAAPTVKKTSFHNFPERGTNYDELLKQPAPKKAISEEELDERERAFRERRAK